MTSVFVYEKFGCMSSIVSTARTSYKDDVTCNIFQACLPGIVIRAFLYVLHNSGCKLHVMRTIDYNETVFIAQ